RGDVLEVEADIFMEGHGQVAARARYRPEAAGRWREAPMRLVENDRWRALIPLTRLGRLIFTVEAWADEVESWRTETGKKLAAGRSIALDLTEGLELVGQLLNAAEGPAAERARRITSEAAAAPAERERLLLSEEFRALMAEAATRRGVVRHPAELVVVVE